MDVRVTLRNITKTTFVTLLVLLSMCCPAGAERLVDTINAIAPGQMPCIGNPKVLVFCVTFPGGNLSEGINHISLTTEEVKEWFFSPVLKYSQDSLEAYSEEDSVRSYFYRSSYGKVDITGDVFEYTAQHDASYYTDYRLLCAELFAYYEDQIIWANYDTNDDGYLDGAYILARTLPAWTSTNYSNFVADYACTVGGIKTNRICYIRSQEFRTFCHETYHMFGLGDIYAGTGVNPAGINTECIMGGGPDGGGLGDIPGISKYVLGWIDTAHFVSGMGSQTIDLSSYSMEGELVIVYPNGDASNNNWFVIEYVTNQVNNRYDGVRIWRTNMYLDEEHNIVGAESVTVGRPEMPTGYLEAISPDDVYNYYYQAGESLSPTSSPSSAYGVVYTLVGSHKYITQSAYSGISIVVDSISDDTARLTITIEDNPASVVGNATFKVIDSDETGEYIDLVEGFHFATVEADCEMKINGELFILDAETGAKIPVTYVLNSKGTQARLLIARENLTAVVLDHTYCLPTAGVFTTYAGTEMSFGEFDSTFEIPNLAVAFTDDSETYYLDRTGYGWWATPVFMRLDAEHVCFADLDTYSDELSLFIIDTENNTTEKRLLEAGITTAYTLPYMAVWQIDAAHFGVLIQMSDSSSYLACYGFDGSKIDGLLLEDDVYQYVGSSTGAFIVNRSYSGKENTRIYEIALEDGALALNSLDFLYDWMWVGSPIQRQIEYINKRDEDTYAIAFTNSDGLTDDPDYRKMQIVSPHQAATYLEAGKSSRWVTVGDRFYHVKITCEGTLELEVHSSDGVVEREVTLLKSLPIQLAWCMDMRVSYEDGLLIVYFNSYSSCYEQSYYSTYLLVFDEIFQLRGYFHGNNTYLDTYSPVYVDDMTFLICGENSYRYISLGRCEDAETYIHMERRGISSTCIQMKTRNLPATCSESGVTDGVICAKCSKVFVEAKEIAATGKQHVWSQGIKSIEPTCIDAGCWLSTCTACGEAKKRTNIAANGHQYEFSYRVEPTCCFDGYAIYNCSVCVSQFEEQYPSTGGGVYDTRNTPATCETEGEILTYCIYCGYNLERQVLPPTGHNQIVVPGEKATCCKPGLSDGIVCGNCGYVFIVQTVLPATGIPDLDLRGDVDDNGIVNVYDALLVLQYSAGWDVILHFCNADYDDDGVIGLFDALSILEYCAGGDMDSALRTLSAMAKELEIILIDIVEQPTDQYTMIGYQAQFAVSATGDGLSYQWYIDRNDGNGWCRLKRATGAAYVTSAVELDNDGYQYRCVIKDAYGNEVTSDTAVLHVIFDLPNTGDEAEPLLYALAMILSVAILLYVYAKKRAWQ